MALSNISSLALNTSKNPAIDKRTEYHNLTFNTQAVSRIHNSTAVIQSKDQSLQLLYKAAVSKINELLSPIAGDNALQQAQQSGLDVSPEATAERIVSLATGFYAAYKEQHPGEDEQQRLQNFMQTIGKGIEQGFKEGREILEGLGVLQGEIAANIDKTYDLVQQGLNQFKQNQLGNDAAE